MKRTLLPFGMAAGAAALAASLLLTPLTAAQTVTPSTSASASASSSASPSTSASASASSSASPSASASASASPSASASASPSPSTCPAPASTTPHDNRYFSQTGFRIDNDAFLDYYNKRGGLATFGYPVSRTFQFLGFTTQFFQRRVMQIGPDGAPRLLNLFDAGLFPFTNINGSTFPAPDPAVVGAAPTVGSPGYSTAVLGFVKQHAPDVYNGKPTKFDMNFLNTVPLGAAFPNGGGDTSLLPGFDLEMWGVVNSQPTVEPTNTNFVYLRWQRGIMMYDASTNLTQGVLLADYFKAVITGNNLPADLALQAKSSSFFQQYNNCMANGLNNPALLPGTNLQFAFEPQ